MTIRFIAIDLDDTLLDAQGNIPAPAHDAILEAQAAGVLITLATGRMFSAARSYAQKLNIQLPIICYQGALMQKHDAEEPLSCLTLSPQLGSELLGILRELQIYYHGYFGDELYVEVLTEDNQNYARHIGVPIKQADDLGDIMRNLPTMEIMAVLEPNRIDEVEQMLRQQLGQDLFITRFRDYVLEFMHPQAGKDKALQTLTAQYGVERHEVMAIGDGYNDINMLQWAGMGVAVANADEKALAAADWICPSNQEAGVAVAIRRALQKV